MQAGLGATLFGNGGAGLRPVIDEHTVTRSAAEAVAVHAEKPHDVIAAFCATHPDESNRRRMVHMQGGTMFSTPSLRVVDAQVQTVGGSVWIYLFTWKS